MSLDNIRRIQSDNIAAGAKHLGDVILYWLEHVSVPRSELKRIFDAHGFGAVCPEKLDPSTALGRAKQRPLPADMKLETIANKRKDTTAAVMLYQITRAPDESGDGFTPGARIRIEHDEAIVLPPEDKPSIGLCVTVASEIAAVANRLVTHAEGRDISGAVIKVLEAHLGAERMRPKGGVYFVLPADGVRWQRFAAALEPFGFVDGSYPLNGDARSLKAAQHVVKSGLEGEIARLQGELVRVGDSTRDGTIENRAAECEALIMRATAFSEILGNVRDGLIRSAEKTRDEFLAKIGAAPASGLTASGGAPVEDDPFSDW